MLFSRPMSSSWLIPFGILCGANAGCLLSDPINEPPVVGSIIGPDKIGRESQEKFKVEADTNRLEWGWFAGTCPANLDTLPRTVLGAPLLYNQSTFSVTTQSLGFVCVWVLARDNEGAETLVWKSVEVENQKPVANILISGFAPNAPAVFSLFQEIKVLGSASDLEKDAVQAFAWTLTTPSGATIPGTPCSEPTDGSVLCFVPPAPGKYVAHLVVTDNLGKPSEQASIPFEVRPDQLPCVRDTEGGGAGTLLRRWDEDVAFTVAVDDDGDPFPPREGQTSKVDFAWLLRKKEAGKQTPMARVTDVNQASFRLPAQSFVQGDEIEVRVEVMDRSAVPVMCAEGDALCLQPSANAATATASPAASAQCSQRLTWTVRYVL